MSEFASTTGVSQCNPLDLIEEERLRNRCQYEAVGEKYKGQIYGIINFSHDESVESFMCQTQVSSSKQVDSEEMNQLRQRLSTTED